MDNSMSPHELKVKFKDKLNKVMFDFISSYVENNKKILSIEDINETKELADKLYNALENLYLEGEMAFPILARHLQELIPQIEREIEYYTEYSNQNKKALLDANKNLESVLEKQKKNLKRNQTINSETSENDKSFIYEYKKVEKHKRDLSNFNKNLQFLYAQIGNKPFKENKSFTHLEEIPDLKELFKSEKYFEHIIERTKGKFHEFDAKNGYYKWKHGQAEYLAAFAYRLREKKRLKDDPNISNNQFLRRVFCKFFHINTIEKTFQPERVNSSGKKEEFHFIVESDR